MESDTKLYSFFGEFTWEIRHFVVFLPSLCQLPEFGTVQFVGGSHMGKSPNLCSVSGNSPGKVGTQLTFQIFVGRRTLNVELVAALVLLFPWPGERDAHNTHEQKTHTGKKDKKKKKNI